MVMVPMALLVGAKAEVWGRKPLFILGLVILTISGSLGQSPNRRLDFVPQKTVIPEARILDYEHTMVVKAVVQLRA
jgi:hypothetical protein